jgi:RNA polymerase sigma factor (sigma-70 family)
MRAPPHSTAAAYERWKPDALVVLRTRCPWLPPDDREAAYHDAFATLLEKHREGALDIGAMHQLQVRGYLMTAVVHRALRIAARAEFRRTEPVEDPTAGLTDPAAPIDEQVVRHAEAIAIREIVEELPERRRAVIKLRFWLDRSPDEIQSFLRISERAYRKELERAFRQLAERLRPLGDGDWCTDRRSLVLAYVAGIAGPIRAERAREHLAGCPACRRMAAELRTLAERAAAVAPMPELALGRGHWDRVTEALVSVKEQASDVATQAKTHAATFVSRADGSAPGYAAGARPGAAVAVVAGCFAIGGGATYCAVEGLPDPLRAIAPSEPQVREGESPTPPKPVKEEIPVEAPPPPATPPPEPTAPSRDEPAPEPPPPPPPTPPAPDPAREFTPDAAAVPSQAAPPAPSSSPPQDSPQAGGGAGEFSP